MINVVRLTSPGSETDFEKEYTDELLLSKVATINETIFENRNLFIYSSNKQINKFPEKISNNDIFIHLSNENLKHQYTYLNEENIILRSYYNPLVKHKRVFAIPLGFQSGFYNKDKINGENNTYMWSFIGQMKTFRKPMYEVFKNINPHYSSVSQEWSSQSLTFDEVKEIYLNTAFAPCPFGSIHPDTIRVMEVLEWGCIPVVVKFRFFDYYKFIYGNHPFIVANNWTEAAQKVESLFKDKNKLRLKQKEVQNWYVSFKDRLSTDMVRIVNGSGGLLSEQFEIQKKGRKNIILKALYYYHFNFKKRPVY